MNRYLSSLVRLLPRPEDPPPAVDWATAEDTLGTPLPSDYKELIDAYGGGHVDDYLLLLEPGCTNDNYDLLAKDSQRREAYEELWKYEEKPREMEEEGNRLIPWATTDNGEYLFWLARPGQNPDAWITLINGEGGADWERYDMTCTRFLASVLSGEIRSEVLWDLFPLAVHRFRPARSFLCPSPRGRFGDR